MQTSNVNGVSQVRVNSRNLGFTQTRENNTKSPCAKEKFDSLVLSRSDLWMGWRCHGIPRVYCYYFLFRTNGKKGHLDDNGFRHCYGNFFRKLLNHSYVQSPFSRNTRHIDNSILKDTLSFFILRIWISMRAKSFIKTSVNVTETRIDEGTQNVHLEEYCTKIETIFHLFYALLFLTNLVFKFNIALIGILASLILKFIQCLMLFYKEQ